MAVKLRLMRMGKKKQPTYRVVAADARSPRNGRFIEILGTYEPRQDPSVIKIDNEKAVDWLRKGAQPTERVRKLLTITGAWEEFSGEAPPPEVTLAASAGGDTSDEPDAPVTVAAAAVETDAATDVADAADAATDVADAAAGAADSADAATTAEAAVATADAAADTSAGEPAGDGDSDESTGEAGAEQEGEGDDA